MHKLITIIFIIFCYNSYCQEVITNDEGKKIKLNNDGSWAEVELDDSTSAQSSEALSKSSLITTLNDEVTGKTYYQMKQTFFVSKSNKYGFGFFAKKDKDDDYFELTIGVVGAGDCFKKESKTLILFRDGSRMALFNEAEPNCDSKFGLIFGKESKNDLKDMEKLFSQEIKIMRIHTNKGFVEMEFEPFESKILMNSLKYLSECN